MEPTAQQQQAKIAKIPVDRLTAILDSAAQAWRAVQASTDPVDRLTAIRVHVARVQAYLAELEKALD